MVKFQIAYFDTVKQVNLDGPSLWSISSCQAARIEDVFFWSDGTPLV